MLFGHTHGDSGASCFSLISLQQRCRLGSSDTRSVRFFPSRNWFEWSWLRHIEAQPFQTTVVLREMVKKKASGNPETNLVETYTDSDLHTTRETTQNRSEGLKAMKRFWKRSKTPCFSHTQQKANNFPHNKRQKNVFTAGCRTRQAEQKKFNENNSRK